MATAAKTHPSRTAKPERVSVEERARRYLSKIPPAVSGQKGHDQTFHAACVLIIGFNVDESLASSLLSEWNSGCLPPWSDKELSRKINQALKEREKNPQDVGRLLGNDERSPNRRPGTSRAPERGDQKSHPTHSARDVSLTTGAQPIAAASVGVGEELEIDASAFARAQVPEPPPQESAAVPVPEQVAATPEDGRREPEPAAIIEVYGSKRRLWRLIQEAMQRAGCRWSKQWPEMRFPNVLAVDDRVYHCLPRVIDGMIVHWGAEPGTVRIGYNRCEVIDGGEVFVLASGSEGNR